MIVDIASEEHIVGKVMVSLSVSLDGFIAGPDDGLEHPLGVGGERLFTWMNAGPETNRVNQYLAPPDASLPVVEAWTAECGAIVSGRRTFDIAGGWEGATRSTCRSSSSRTRHRPRASGAPRCGS